MIKMNKQMAVSLLITAGVLMLLAGCIFSFMQQWIYAALVWVGAFGCLVAALNFKNWKDEYKMQNNVLILYIHGKEGTAEEANHYKRLFSDCDVVGFDYIAETPWEAKSEFPIAFQTFSEGYDRVILIANSVGAYFSMCALPQEKIEKAYFISPIVDMEKLIGSMMIWANVSEDDLREKNTIETSFGETLSWEYLCYVRNHPICWNVPTEILYGGQDNLTERETINVFADTHGANLTIMENGEHWFHTLEQMEFLDNWINNCKMLKAHEEVKVK